MTGTFSTYLGLEKNLATYQKMETNKPQVKNDTAYYEANIGKVKSIDDFVGNYRLLSYALKAYGLGDQVNNTALIKKVLEGGTTSSTALANTLPNANWKLFAEAFGPNLTGSAAPTSPTSIATTTSKYVEHSLETDEGQQDVGVELALYFKRVAPTITSGLQVIADKNLLEVVQTIFNLPAAAGATQIDQQAKEIENLMPMKDLQDPKKLETLVERFAASYDSDYGPGGKDASSSLTVTDGNTPKPVVAATGILSGMLSSNPTASNFASILSALALGGN